MTLGDLIRWAESIVPECDETVLPSISTTQLCKRDILNEAALEFAKYTRCLPKDKKFNCVSDTQTYPISANVADFFSFKEEGLWHLRSDTSTRTWVRVKPVTVRYLDDTYPSWRTMSATDLINYCWQDGDTIGLFYTPSSSVANGLHIYYYGLPSEMTITTNYPFTGNATEDPRLKPYAKILLVYYEYRVLLFLGYKDDAFNKEKEFYMLCDKAKTELQTRRDIAQTAQMRPKTYLSQMR